MKKKFLIFAVTVAVSLLTLSQTVSAFSDVSEDDDYYYAVSYLLNNGIIQGYEDGTFKPNKDVSRVEALKIILLSANIEITDNNIELELSDIENNVWYTPYVKTAVNMDIVQGYDDNKFYPTKNVNFAEGIKILIETFGMNYERFETNDYLEYENWYDKYFEVADANYLLNFNENIDPAEELTRSDLAKLIYYALKPEDSPYYSDENYEEPEDEIVEEEIIEEDPEDEIIVDDTEEEGEGEGEEEPVNEGSFSNFEVGSTLICRATYYGYAFAGNNTASGEPFDPEAMTAAHKELPFGTIVKVTNLENDATVTVRINDRGPFTPGLEIDLSQAAFASIANLSCGVLNVKLEIIEAAE